MVEYVRILVKHWAGKIALPSSKKMQNLSKQINGWDVTVNACDSVVLMCHPSLSHFADTILKQEESKEQEDSQLVHSS